MSGVASSPAVAYARWCVSEPEKLVPRYVKIQCEVWLQIVDGLWQDAYVDDGAYGLFAPPR